MRLLAILPALFLATGCQGAGPAEPPPPAPIAPATADADPAAASPEPEAAGAAVAEDAASENAAADVPPDPMDPRHFAGFSEDESRFAYGAYSEGARAHLFTVVDAATGRRVTDFPLDTEENLARARRLLEEGGFSPDSADGRAALLSDESLQVEVEGGAVRIWLVQEGARARLEPAEAYAEAVRRLQRVEAELWGFSTYGTYVAVRLVEDQGPALGKATTYQVLSLPQARVALQ
jgi:hypothetical protein